jgi:hypothetical protein
MIPVDRRLHGPKFGLEQVGRRKIMSLPGHELLTTGGKSTILDDFQKASVKYYHRLGCDAIILVQV